MKSLNNKYMHLTNYSINKKNNEYQPNGDESQCQGHKWLVRDDFFSIFVRAIFLCNVCFDKSSSSDGRTYRCSSQGFEGSVGVSEETRSGHEQSDAKHS